MKKTFEELKKILLEKAKEKGACKIEYYKALKAENEIDLLSVIFDNIDWCSSMQIISEEYFSYFNSDNFLKSGIANTGKENTGFINSGDGNSGDRNSGDRNSGNWNSGDRNSGDRNSGNGNSGDRNSGDWNSGDGNSGDRNSGDRNSGNLNSGNWNSGDRNSGDGNSGYRNSGAFCTDPNPRIFLFNKPSKYTAKEWEQTRAYQLMHDIDTNVWVQWSAMSEDDKKINPTLEASDGYTKSIPLKEAWANAWGNWSEENKRVFTELDNFDSKIFEEITGIKV